jgi:NSS family neurotransmitter:Na+ symporter
MTEDAWRSRTGFVLAALGSAVGLGNIWRFPYLAYRNGGGAFLIPYLIAIAVIGMSLMLAELTIGHRFRSSQPKVFHSGKKGWEIAGWWAISVGMLGVTLYYCAIIGWTVNFLLYSFTLSWEPDPQSSFFKTFLGLTSGPTVIGGLRIPIVISTAIVWAACWAVVSRGIAHGIERALKAMMPLMILLLVTLMVWTIFLPGAGAGIAAYLKPDFSKLLVPRVWTEAVGQTFFSLSLGFGIIVAYARYLPRDANLSADARWIVLGDSSFAIFAGFVVFGTMGFMAQLKGLPIGEVVKGGPGLTFVAFPQAISSLPGMRAGFGALFFLALFIAGLSSAISLIEALTSSLTDKFGVDRKRIVTIICIAGFLGSLLFTTGAGLFLLDIVDHHVTQYGLVLSGLFVSLFVGWVLKEDDLHNHIWGNTPSWIGKCWIWLLRYLIPALLTILIAWTLVEDLRKPYEGYPVSVLIILGLGWLVLLALVAYWASRQKWVTRSVS